MTGTKLRTLRLRREHNRTGFRCGEPALDEYLCLRAGQDVQRGVTNVFVTVAPGSNDVLGFYSLSAHALDLADMPGEILNRLPRYAKVPAILLGRLAVHEDAQGQKLGELLLIDALQRSLLSDIGWVIFLVQAKHERAAAFYRHYEFQPFSHSPLTLYIHRKTASAVCSHSD